MNVLISAYACDPFEGSEPGVGWNWVLLASGVANVWVITRANNRPSIEASAPGRPREYPPRLPRSTSMGSVLEARGEGNETVLHPLAADGRSRGRATSPHTTLLAHSSRHVQYDRCPWFSLDFARPVRLGTGWRSPAGATPAPRLVRGRVVEGEAPAVTQGNNPLRSCGSGCRSADPASLSQPTVRPPAPLSASTGGSMRSAWRPAPTRSWNVRVALIDPGRGYSGPAHSWHAKLRWLLSP